MTHPRGNKAHLTAKPEKNNHKKNPPKTNTPRKQYRTIPRDYPTAQASKWDFQTTNVGAQDITEDNDCTYTTSVHSRSS